jgi:uncharacterized protein YbaR (Trm112 family)
MISTDLQNILVCPVCRGELAQDAGPQNLLCRGCGLAFPVRNDIPILLADQAHSISEQDTLDPL